MPFPAVVVALAGLSANSGLLEQGIRSMREGDLVLFRPDGRVAVVTRVGGPVPSLREALADPTRYRAAVPALVRSDVVGERRFPGRPEATERLVAWELEIPLFNLEGKLWVRPVGESGVEIELVEGDLAPGRFRFGIAPGPPAVAWLEGSVNLRKGGWLARRMLSASPHAGPAMTAAAVWVLLRGAVLVAENPTETAARRPRGASPWPAFPDDSGATSEARPLLDHDLDGLRQEGILAAVRSEPTGHLGSVAVLFPLSADRSAALSDPSSLRAFPGWRRVSLGDRGFTVDSNLAFTDFDATWKTVPGASLNAQAVSGATRGARLTLVPPPPGLAHGALVMHPRLDKTGWLPRRFIAAEPLLEHGLALALAYVDALSLARALE